MNQVSAAEFSYPFWFPSGAKSLLDKILDPNPETRIKIDGIWEHPWFQVNYVLFSQGVEADVSLDDVCAMFDDIEDQYVMEHSKEKITLLTMNAFEMITLSQELNLSALFDRRQGMMGNEPDVAEFISAIAAGNNAQLMVIVGVPPPGPPL